MKNIKSVSNSSCNDCQHNIVCRYKSLMVEAVEALKTDNLDESAPFKIDIICDYKSPVVSTIKTVEPVIERKQYQYDNVVEDIDKSSMYDTKMITADVFNTTPKDANGEPLELVERRLK